MKTVKQEYTPVPKYTVRVIITHDNVAVKRLTLQTTTVGEYKMLKALCLYQGQPSERIKRGLPRSQSSQAHIAAQAAANQS